MPDKLELLHRLPRSSSDAASMAKELPVKSKVITVHLDELEKLVLIEDVALSQGKRPVEVKYYRLTQKGKNIYKNIVRY